MSRILTPEEVTERFGEHFCQGFFTLVDEKNGIAQVIDVCIAKGPVEWDAVNRRKAGGVITGVRVEGTTLIMDARIGAGEVNFGPASKDLGGQALKALEVEGDTVKTTWVGVAGASVGVGACLPQAKETIQTEYPDDLKIGGAHRMEVTISTPKMVRVIYAVDDTDTKEEGASWAMMLQLARSCPYGKFLEHKIIQLNPNVPNKTTNCVSVGISFAVKEKNLDRLTKFVVDYVKEHTISDDTVLSIFKGLKVPEELIQYGLRAKEAIITVEEAKETAEKTGLEVVEITGEEGIIGAVAGIGCFDMGLKSAALPEDFDRL